MFSLSKKSWLFHITILVVSTIVLSAFFISIDFFETWYHLARNYKNFKLDELFSIVIAALLIGSCSSLYYVFFLKDFSKKLQLSNLSIQENAAQSSQQEKLAALGELSGGIAHEINNALQPIIGLSDILLRRLEKLDDPQAIEYMQVIADSGDHAQKIISSILAFARNHGTDFKLHDAYEVASEMTEFARMVLPDQVALEASGIDILKRRDDLYIHCNLTALSQITMNVMKNASDAMHNTGTVSLSIETKELDKDFCTQNALHGQHFIVFKIRDEGCGMTQDTIDKIFDPFFTTKDEGEGTGLGLSMSYGIAQSHQGTLVVESTLGEGAEFQLILPLIDKELYDSLHSHGAAS